MQGRWEKLFRPQIEHFVKQFAIREHEHDQNQNAVLFSPNFLNQLFALKKLMWNDLLLILGGTLRISVPFLLAAMGVFLLNVRE
ncbi:MAG: hypothetical protein CM1200mP30_04330 [Pseudomonadota bacterium]|nr:MAG: hypothetical protein CM1200mP30_04330 [Pseudomonadota bacterium]